MFNKMLLEVGTEFTEFYLALITSAVYRDNRPSRCIAICNFDIYLL